MEVGRPSSRQYAGQWNLLGAPEHRAVARQAARESLVLLKNEDAILPLRLNQRVLVAGEGADSMSKQTGGWTISWQGDGNSRADFPNGETIFEGIRTRVQSAGGTATLSVDGSFTARPDVAIVVFGEDPYAEFAGDRDTLDYEPEADLALLRRLRAQGIPVISVFLSGRPMYVTPEINASNAFVAAWLPGSEGGAIADVLFRNADGSIASDFRGRLSFSWPRSPDQTPLNVGDANYDPLFAYDYGLRYTSPRNLGTLQEAAASTAATANTTVYVRSGRAAQPWRLDAADISTREAENQFVAAWPAGGGRLAARGEPINLSRQANGDMSLTFELAVDAAPSGPATLAMRCGENCGGEVDVTSLLRPGGRAISVRLSCFAAAGADMSRIDTPFELSAPGMQAAIESVRITPGEGIPSCPGGAR
jgi:beta-glucosidase